MTRTISESKRDALTDLLKQLEDQISKVYYRMESDKEISDYNFKVYDKMIEQLNHIHTELLEEITYS